ncbi:MAG: phosphatidylserine decarboxylase family protein [Magnetococcales bacterium]|nr:phosphatidylserine decarboxylase family protein [Magnetococcales bacterium]MBF0629515.1 phosphatidylserine decarboxylase family protein [Magnetococcales bacterium]
MVIRSPVAREGWPFILGFAVVAGLASMILPNLACMLPFWLLTVWCVWFFRDPERVTPTEPGIWVAPADGRVVAIEEVAQAPLGLGPARKCSIFMNVFSVHVNRVPMTGRIEALAYHPGRFLNAELDKASVENERMELLMKGEHGIAVVFVQVAGLVARRIVCRVRQGDRLERGERFGLIRFGSRVDLYLPREAQILLALGDRTRAGETVMARLELETGG